MKNIYKIGWMIGLWVAVSACTKDNFIETGVANGRFQGSLLEYLEAPTPLNNYNWDSTALLVRRAGPEMIRLFEGKDPEHLEITFLGATNHSIRRYMLDNGISSIQAMEPEECEEFLKRLIIDGKFYRKEIAKGILGENGMPESGGKYFMTLAGYQVWVYSFTEEFQQVSDIGHTRLSVFSGDTFMTFNVASADIEPDNCVVHALDYSYTLGDF